MKTDTLPAAITKYLDILILGFAAYLCHQTIFVWFVEFSFYGGSPQLQLALLAILVLLIAWRLRFENLEKPYFKAWRSNISLALFLLLAFASLFWTVSIPATLYRVFLALMVTIIGAFIGLRFSAKNLVDTLAIVIAIFALASLILILFIPSVGIHPSWPYEGLWRGIFWNKIYLGATLALGYIAGLMILFSPPGNRSGQERLLAAFLILLCAGLAIKSDSASGLIVLAIQTVLFILLKIWLAWGQRLTRRVYFWLAGLAAIFLILITTNLGFIFRLFNRSANMTGRTPMWQHLIDHYISRRPLFGYGFGAFWLQPGIMQKVQEFVGWKYPVRVADNGYLDMTLGLGLAGLLLLFILLLTAFWRSLRAAIQERELVSFFPLFILVHITAINISLSYFFEGETFIWLLLVTILFMQSPGLKNKAA